ncbi:MAG TPA: AAA family ATPase, partial [Dissulfurispiraceae bacterium]|nr:AAA family ATPase [Dissulfurispiraceae bacterium]
KKPVNFGFLDFTSLEKRKFFCEEEVRLNRRFCPDTYLDVTAVCADSAGIHLGLPGDPIEYLVKMVRLPEDRMLTHLLAADSPELLELMARLGNRLAGVHLSLPSCWHDEGFSELDHVRRNWEENFAQTKSGIGRIMPAHGFTIMSRFVHDFLSEHAGLIEAREQQGWVRECHGDLHADHVCFTDPIRMFDCIEFNRRFRVSDILSDLAFLVMDLEKNQRSDLALLLRQSYEQALNAAIPSGLLRFYKIYRAYVRGKVGYLRSNELDAGTDAHRAALQKAVSFLSRALGYLMPQALLVTCGIMGTGKSSLALHLAQALNANVSRSDQIRHDLYPVTGASPSDFLQGAYLPELTERVYGSMLQKAADLLNNGSTVILDATFGDTKRRAQARELAAVLNIPIIFFHCRCPRHVALERLVQRADAGTDISEGRADLYDLQAAQFVPPAPDEQAVPVDTIEDIDYVAISALSDALCYMGIESD